MSIKTHNNGTGLLHLLWKTFTGDVGPVVPARSHASDTVGHMKGKVGAMDRFEMASSKNNLSGVRSRTIPDPQYLAVCEYVMKKPRS